MASISNVRVHPKRSQSLLERVRETYRRLRLYAEQALPELIRQPEPVHER